MRKATHQNLGGAGNLHLFGFTVLPMLKAGGRESQDLFGFISGHRVLRCPLDQPGFHRAPDRLGPPTAPTASGRAPRSLSRLGWEAAGGAGAAAGPQGAGLRRRLASAPWGQ